MDGRVGFSIHLSKAVLRSRIGLRLKDGEIVSVRVDGKTAPNRYAVTVRGVPINIRSTQSLEIGTVLRARVAVVAGRIELKVLGAPLPQLPERIGTLVERVAPAGLPKDFATLIIQSMQRSSMPVTPEAVAVISSMIPQLRRKDAGFVRFATILYDKHLRVEPDRLEELFQSVSGAGDRGNRGGNSPQSGYERGHTHREPVTGLSAPGPENPESEPAANLESVTSQEIAAQLMDQVSGNPGENVGWPALFNHSAGRHESWVIVPFSVGTEATTVDGSVRLLLDSTFLNTHGRTLPPSRILKASVAVAGIGAFEILGNPPKRILFHAESIPIKSEITEFLPELGEKLRNLGVEIDDTNNGGAVYDGFSAETHEIRGVDASA